MLQLQQHLLMLGVGGLMLAVESFADKIPGVDTLWDVLHTLLRIPAGAALAAAAFGADSATITTAAALLGGTLPETSHFAKATTRAAVNTSPEPFSNIGLSHAGDAAVPAALSLAWAHPWAFFGVLAPALMGVLLWMLGSLLGELLRRLGSVGGGPAPTATWPATARSVRGRARWN